MSEIIFDQPSGPIFCVMFLRQSITANGYFRCDVSDALPKPMRNTFLSPDILVQSRKSFLPGTKSEFVLQIKAPNIQRGERVVPTTSLQNQIYFLKGGIFCFPGTKFSFYLPK